MQWRTSDFDPWVGKIPWSWAWQPTLVFLPGKTPWTEEPGVVQSMESQRVGHKLIDEAQQYGYILKCMALVDSF